MFIRKARNSSSSVSLATLVRSYRILAIESSCDDSCIALLERKSASAPLVAIDQVKLTLNSSKVGGIIPTDAHSHHQSSLAPLLDAFVTKHSLHTSTPDLVCCTRGPGMVGSLSAGLQLAKGLAVAWNKPLIGVHHMLGHILIAMLPSPASSSTPRYPFLSLLCSGGHTMLVLLKSITDHRILVNTMDIAAGDSLDKCARELGIEGIMLAKEMEQYINTIPSAERDRFAKVNTSQGHLNKYNFKLGLPLRRPKHGKEPDEELSFAFSGFLSSIQSYKAQKSITEFDEETRLFIAYKTQEKIFDHIIDRINLALLKHHDDIINVKDFIVSGGVAANKQLRNKLSTNCKFPDNDVSFHFPSLELCTDNAIMIGVAGVHLLEELRVKSDLSILPIRKWPLDEIIEKDGWIDISSDEYNEITRET